MLHSRLGGKPSGTAGEKHIAARLVQTRRAHDDADTQRNPLYAITPRYPGVHPDPAEDDAGKSLANKVGEDEQVHREGAVVRPEQVRNTTVDEGVSRRRSDALLRGQQVGTQQQWLGAGGAGVGEVSEVGMTHEGAHGQHHAQIGR